MSTITNPNVAVFLADGCEEIEALTVVDLLARAGIPVKTVSIKDDPVIISSHKVTIIADTTIDALDFSSVSMIVLPGGIPGTPNLKACKVLTDQILAFYEAGKDLAAICAAPTILASLGLLSGRPATCYPSMEDEMEDAIVKHEPYVISDNIITGRGMGCAIPFSLAIIEYYLGEEKAADIARKIVYLPGKE